MLSPPGEIPPVFRGGRSLVFQPHEVKIDKSTGLLKTTHGVSVDADVMRVVPFGGAYRVRALPDGLAIIQRGGRAEHFEIVPRQTDYARALSRIAESS